MIMTTLSQWVATILVALSVCAHGSPDGRRAGDGAPGRVLFISPIGSKSHNMFYNGIVNALVDAGHHVTFVSAFPNPRKHANLTQFNSVTDITLHMPNSLKVGFSTMMQNLSSSAPTWCFDALMNPGVQEIMKQDYDLAYVSLFFNYCFLPVIHDRKIPLVHVNPGECFGSGCSSLIGSPYLSSIDYNPLSSFRHPKAFWQRGVDTIANWALTLFPGLMYDGYQSMGLTRGAYTTQTTHIKEAISEASSIVANSFRLAETPRPYMPNILLAGGIHCREAEPLPKDLEDWVSSAEHGFIFFSLGSAVRPEDIPDHNLQQILSVFARLPQKVLWKHNHKSLPGQPPNVRLIKWAPQQDLLGHPNIRLFITHGGLFSTQESTFHGVPVIGLPVFADQDGNMAGAELEGWGKRLSWKTLTENIFQDAVDEMLNKPEAREAAQRVGALMRDRPQRPSQEVVWWAGYLMRTGGAKHLRSPALDLTWYELFNVDVWAAIVLAVVLVMWLMVKLLMCLCCRHTANNDNKLNTKKSEKKKLK